MARPKSLASAPSTATIGFEAKLWLTADKLRNNMDAAEYKHVVLGLIFLKYISDTFEEHRAKLLAGEGDYAGANPEDPDEYKAENVFWVPADARWAHLQAIAKQSTIGKTVVDAMVAIERDNPRLKGVLPKDYARPGLDKHRLGELIDVIATIELTAASEGEKTHRSVDLLGRVYEYFLTRFASAEGKNGGQFYTPSCVVRCLVEMLAPYKGRIYDPACGSGGMFVQSEKFVESHGGKLGDISIYGQESNATTRRLAVMNLALRGIEADFGPEHADTFRRDLHPDLRADYVLANPPFNDSDTALRDSAFLQSEAKMQVVSEAKDNFRKDDYVRWQPSGARSTAKGNPQGERGDVHQFGVSPKGNANFAWVQHFIHHLAPQGMAGFVIGGFRDRYRAMRADGKMSKDGPPVDASGVLPDERKFSGIREFQTLLAADTPQLLKNLAQQLAIYSTGRDLAFSDRDEIAAIVTHTQRQGGGLRTLIHELVQSRLFQTR